MSLSPERVAFLWRVSKDLPGWEEFLQEKYQGGKAKVKNQNPDTRGSFPEVSVSTAMKDERVRQQVLKEFHQWKGSEKSDDKTNKPLPNKEEAWHDVGTSFNTHREKWNAEEKDAVRFYSDELGYKVINDLLREKKQPDEDSYDDYLRAVASIPHLDAAFKKSRTEKDVVVSRGIGKNSPFGKMLLDGTLQKGMVQIDDGYTSTSIKPPEANDWPHDVMMTIKVPKGTPAVYLGPPPGPKKGRGEYSESPEEYELLLNRRTKLKVVGFDRAKK